MFVDVRWPDGAFVCAWIKVVRQNRARYLWANSDFVDTCVSRPAFAERWLIAEQSQSKKRRAQTAEHRREVARLAIESLHPGTQGVRELGVGKQHLECLIHVERAR